MGLELTHLLCGECGVITKEEEWSYLQRDEETDELRDSRPDESDPIMRCPICLHHHTDDDGDSGVWDGNEERLESQREELVKDNPNYIAWWIDALVSVVQIRKELNDLFARSDRGPAPSYGPDS